VSPSVVGGEGVTIRIGRPALNPPLMAAGTRGRILPRPVVGHRAFNGKDTPVVIDDDEKERRGLFCLSFSHFPKTASVTAIDL